MDSIDAGSAHGDDSDRIRISRPVLYFGLLGSSIVWFFQLVFKYAINSHACYPGSHPAGSLAPVNLGWMEPLMVGVDVAALAIALAAAFVSYRDWNAILRETGVDALEPTDAMESPARFFALWGMAFAFCFAAAIVFDLINVLVLNRCG